MKSLFFIGLLALTACDDAKFKQPTSEPPPEVLEEELQNTDKSNDGDITPPSVELEKDFKGDHVDLLALKDLRPLGYEVLVVINKAPLGLQAQTLSVYHKGHLSHVWLTSTGKEVPTKNKLGRRTTQITPLGYFTPLQGRLYENYFSASWKAEMPHSIFFIGGVAIHGTSEVLYPELGRRASGGCVRLKKKNAAKLFDLVKNVAGRGRIADVTRNGQVRKNPDGSIVYKEGYRTLIVVVDEMGE